MSRSATRRAPLTLAFIILFVFVLCMLLFPHVFSFEVFPVDSEQSGITFADLERSESPNDFLMAPPQFARLNPEEASPHFRISASQLQAEFQLMLEGFPRVEVLSRSSPGQLSVIQRSRVFRFPDLILIQFFPVSSNQSTLAIYSRSLYGHSDLGVNRDRVSKWTLLLKARMAQLAEDPQDSRSKPTK